MVETDGVQGVAANANPTAEAPSAQAAADADMGVEIQQAKKPEIKLEDLFEGMDSDDDDFLGSNNQLNAKEPAVEVDHDPSFELLRIYYQRFFPWRYMFQWLNHSPVPTNDFKHREFSLWLHNDAVMRYQSYATSDLFRKDVLRLMPRRIEIGPVYTADPIDRKSYRNSTAFLPMAKELCFDIDLTDYDDIRTCCDKANICNKCWKFTTMAIKVMDTALREDFGYRHILWVYSGRRGVHAWVCDKQARTLQDHQRKAMASYFEVVSGKAGGKRVNVRRPLHPHLSRSIDLLKEHFQRDVLEAQDPWASPEKADALLLQHLPDVELREALRKKWDASPGRTSSSKWADIDALAQAGAVGAAFDPKDLLDAKQDILLEHAYPRLDIAVSQKLNHLLKSPFVIHPGTGRVCVPIDRRDLDGFDPLNVPTLQGLVREVDAWRGGGGGAAAEGAASGGGEGAGGGAGGSSQEVKHVQDWEKTSLKPYIEYFRSFVTALMKDERAAGVKREREEDGDVEVKAESLDF
ncbi:prim-pol domain-containing protein [Parathielavia hyrcaniae]|uniref:DNA primase n=1 Tax=Parathielavia hyrcaniae TaxID=113614 RepID=A0AAN6SYP3_9PEZI|nr:prim-pol domain-containing protein [Parathielavia hyrcaniae]